jgi:AcrR family transcriptional regulator
VNEAILFRHFPHKEDLYWAVIDEKCRTSPGRKFLDQQLASATDDQQMFTAIAREMLERNTRDTTLTRLLLFTALEKHELSERFFQTYVAAYFATLADYIRRRIRAGGYRRVNPTLAARSFLGMVIHYFLTQEIFGAGRYQKFDIQDVSETLADIWLKGIKAK